MCPASILERPFDDLLREAMALHGHLCPGQVLGVRMTVAGCRAPAVAHPQQAGKRLVVFVEIDRCATDAIQALTGVSLGKRTLKHVDYGKAAATFVDPVARQAVRVVARDDARARGRRHAVGARCPAGPDCRLPHAAGGSTPASGARDHRAGMARPAPRAGPVRQCGEGVSYEREVRAGGRVLCRACAGEAYYNGDRRGAERPMTVVITPGPAPADADRHS